MQKIDIEAVLNQTTVSFCVDTNILVEFKRLNAIPWHQLTPNATEIPIIVPTKVGEEMDAHKKKTGRLRRRGIEFSEIARSIENSPHQIAELQADKPRLTVEFARIFRRTELDGDLYELDDDDGRIIAEVAKIMEANPYAVLLSDDAKPIRLAKQTNLLHSRPPEEWRREEGPDERDAEIADLRQTLGAQPTLVLSFPDGDANPKHLLTSPPAVACGACIEGLVNTALSVDQRVSREALVKRYGVEPRTPFGNFALYTSRLTHSDLDEYDADYMSFVDQVRRWAKNLPSLLQTPRTFLPITIAVGNEGDRAAERVHVEAELRGSFEFAPLEFFDELFEKTLEAPDAPTPTTSPFIPDLRSRFLPKERRADRFYVQDKPGAGASSTRVSWRCEELRQGTSYKLRVLVVSDEPGLSGALVVRASGAVIAKVIDLTAPLVPSPSPNVEPFWRYLSSHLEMLPKKYRRPFTDAQNMFERTCTCTTSNPS